MATVYTFKREDITTQEDWEAAIKAACETEKIDHHHIDTLDYAYRAAFTVVEFMGLRTIVALHWDRAGLMDMTNFDPGDQVSLSMFFETPHAFYGGQGMTGEDYSPNLEALYDQFKREHGDLTKTNVDDFHTYYDARKMELLSRHWDNRFQMLQVTAATQDVLAKVREAAWLLERPYTTFTSK